MPTKWVGGCGEGRSPYKGLNPPWLDSSPPRLPHYNPHGDFVSLSLDPKSPYPHGSGGALGGALGGGEAMGGRVGSLGVPCTTCMPWDGPPSKMCQPPPPPRPGMCSCPSLMEPLPATPLAHYLGGLQGGIIGVPRGSWCHVAPAQEAPTPPLPPPCTAPEVPLLEPSITPWDPPEPSHNVRQSCSP